MIVKNKSLDATENNNVSFLNQRGMLKNNQNICLTCMIIAIIIKIIEILRETRKYE